MSPVIYVYVNMFDKDAELIAFDENGKQTSLGFCPIEELPESIPAICYSKDVENVHLFGYEPYINGLVKEIKNLTYSNKILNIEVN